MYFIIVIKPHAPKTILSLVSFISATLILPVDLRDHNSDKTILQNSYKFSVAS